MFAVCINIGAYNFVMSLVLNLKRVGALYMLKKFLSNIFLKINCFAVCTNLLVAYSMRLVSQHGYKTYCQYVR